MGIQVTFRLPVQFRQDGDIMVARCPALDVVTQGRDRDQATHNIQEAVSLFLESCIARGTIDEVLRACGWSKVQALVEADDQTDMIDVPFELLANDQNNAHRLAQAC